MTAAVPYYERFVAELPDPAALAACDPERLRKLWQGLGYYSRAANLQKAAKIICERYGGRLPADYDALRGAAGHRGLHRRGHCQHRVRAARAPRWTATCCGCLPGWTTTTPT